MRLRPGHLSAQDRQLVAQYCDLYILRVGPLAQVEHAEQPP